MTGEPVNRRDRELLASGVITEEAREFMLEVVACDEHLGKDGLCACARFHFEKVAPMLETLWASEACMRANSDIGDLGVDELDQLFRWQEHLHREALGLPHEYQSEEDFDPDDRSHLMAPDPKIGRALVKRVLDVPESEW